jgi:hypothetical protein
VSRKLEATCLVATAVYVLGYADRLRTLSLIGKLGRIVQHKQEIVGGGRTITGRLKVTSQDIRLADPIIRQESIGRLGVGPILANQRNALSHSATDLRQQFAKPAAKPRIPKFASSDFPINPTSRTRPLNQRIIEHLANANQVLSNESQGILSIQVFANRLPLINDKNCG